MQVKQAQPLLDDEKQLVIKSKDGSISLINEQNEDPFAIAADLEEFITGSRWSLRDDKDNPACLTPMPESYCFFDAGLVPFGKVVEARLGCGGISTTISPSHCVSMKEECKAYAISIWCSLL